MFTEREQRYLEQAHGSMVYMDIETMQIPAHILANIHARRAKKLGTKFTEFRKAAGETGTRTYTYSPSLEEQITHEKLF